VNTSDPDPLDDNAAGHHLGPDEAERMGIPADSQPDDVDSRRRHDAGIAVGEDVELAAAGALSQQADTPNGEAAASRRPEPRLPAAYGGSSLSISPSAVSARRQSLSCLPLSMALSRMLCAA